MIANKEHVPFKDMSAKDRGTLKAHYRECEVRCYDDEWVKATCGPDGMNKSVYRYIPTETPMKQEMIEKLKGIENVPWAWLDSLLRMELKVVNDGHNIQFKISREDTWHHGDNLGWHDKCVYRLDPSWQPPVEAPEGMRLLTHEDRKRFKYPEDCKVVWRSHGMSQWYPSTDDTRWHGGSLLPKNALFAVPSDYTFAEDRKRWFFTTNSHSVLMVAGSSSQWLAGFGSLSSSQSGHTAESALRMPHTIEVQGHELDYLHKPKGEGWEFRVPEVGDTVILCKTGDDDRCVHGAEYVATRVSRRRSPIHGLRWCKAKAEELTMTQLCKELGRTVVITKEAQ